MHKGQGGCNPTALGLLERDGSLAQSGGQRQLPRLLARLHFLPMDSKLTFHNCVHWKWWRGGRAA